MDINLSKLQEIVEDRGDERATVREVAKSWTQLSNWTTTLEMYYYTVSYPCDATKRQPVFTIRISFMNCSIITQRNLWVTMLLFFGQSSFLTMCFGSWVGKIPWRREQLLTPVILAWRIPWTVQFMGSQSAGHNWVTLTFTSVSEIQFCVQHSYCLIHFCLHRVFDAVSLLSLVLASGSHPLAASHHSSFSWGAWALELVGSGSGVQALLLCSMWDLPGAGSNLCPLRWQADSQLLHYQGSPIIFLI